MHRLLLLIGFALASCSPAYVPNMRNVPMFGASKEFAGGVAMGTTGVEAQIAYSLSDHIAVMANGEFLTRKDEIQGYKLKRHQNFGEVGIGYFLKAENLRIEVFGGYGFGKSTSYNQFDLFGSDHRIAKGTFNRIFLQPSISTNTADFNIILTPRFTMVRFPEFEVSSLEGDVLENIPDGGYKLHFEPSLTARCRLVDGLHGFFQLGIAGSLKSTYFETVPMQFGLGLQFYTGQRKRDN